MTEAPTTEGRFTPTTALWLIVSVASQVAATLCFRIAGLRTAEGAVVSTWLDPFFALGIGSLVLQALVWPLVLRRIPLSRAYPFMAFVPPLNLLVAATILMEQVRLQHAVGIGILAAGIWLLAGRPR